MAFQEVQFPLNISYGTRGGPGWNTAIVETDSGAEERTARWSQPRHQFDAAYGIKKRNDLSTVKEFYIARQGAANGFRFKDFLDFTTAVNHRDDEGAVAFDDHEIGTGDGSNKSFQLSKKYTSGAFNRTRNITKPVTGTIRVGVNGVEKTISVDFTVDTTTGIVLFTVAPPNGQSVTAGCEFDVPVRFGSEADELLEASQDAFDMGTIPGIPMIELVDEVPQAEEFFFGGGEDATFGANITLALADGRVRRLDPTTTGLKVILPGVDDLPAGGPYFYIFNVGTESFDVVAPDLTVLATLTTAQTKIIILSETALGVKNWYAV